MEYRVLGKSGIRVSLIGLGTVKLGRNQGVRYARPFRIPTVEGARRLLDGARELGINLVDTAPAYGSSEETLGTLLQGQRKDWILCTKVGEAFHAGVSRYDFSPEAVKQSVERSLEKLATDYLDVVLIHSNGDDLEILDNSGALDALRELRQQGSIRAVGISHKSLDGARRALELGVDVIMAALNPSETEQLPVVRAAGALGCGVLVKKALRSGHGIPADLSWVAAQSGVSSIVVGTISPEHLRANVSAVCTTSQRS